jgi:hypothetical protein
MKESEFESLDVIQEPEIKAPMEEIKKEVEDLDKIDDNAMDSDILNQNFGTLLQNNEFRTALEEEKIFDDLDMDKIDFNENRPSIHQNFDFEEPKMSSIRDNYIGNFDDEDIMIKPSNMKES